MNKVIRNLRCQIYILQYFKFHLENLCCWLSEFLKNHVRNSKCSVINQIELFEVIKKIILTVPFYVEICWLVAEQIIEENLTKNLNLKS